MTKRNQKLYNKIEEMLVELNKQVAIENEHEKQIVLFTKRYVLVEVQRILLCSDNDIEYDKICKEIMDY